MVGEVALPAGKDLTIMFHTCEAAAKTQEGGDGLRKFHFNHSGSVLDTFVALETTTANITNVAIATQAVF